MDEIELLEIRLHELSGIVDVFYVADLQGNVRMLVGPNSTVLSLPLMATEPSARSSPGPAHHGQKPLLRFEGEFGYVRHVVRTVSGDGALARRKQRTVAEPTDWV